MIDLHIIPNSPVMRETITLYRRYLNIKSTPFIVLGGSAHYKTDDFENVFVVSDTLRSAYFLYKWMKRADRVHVHGLFSPYLLLILATYKSIGKKTVWYIYGDDLYCLLRPKKTLKNLLHLHTRRCAYKFIKFVSTTVRGDYQLLKKIMNKEYVFYEKRFRPSCIESIKPYLSNEHSKDKVNILVGNSATKSNCHADVFEKLSKIINDDYAVYVPLSYGDLSYREKVIEAGGEMLGSLFHPLTEFLPMDEYYSFLSNVDIAIFACDRQQAIGNIVPLLYAGAKVFIRNDTSMWDCFSNEYGLSVFNYYDLNTISEHEFKRKCFDIKKQKILIENMTDAEKYANCLKQIQISKYSEI